MRRRKLCTYKFLLLFSLIKAFYDPLWGFSVELTLPILDNSSFDGCLNHFKLAAGHVRSQVDTSAGIYQIHSESIIRPRPKMEIAFLIIKRKELDINGTATSKNGGSKPKTDIESDWDSKFLLPRLYYIHCLQVAITTLEGGLWGYPYIKISPYR